MTDDSYVTNSAWVRQIGRPDAIDEVADQFERPVPDGKAEFWTGGSAARWPHSSGGWRSMDRLHSRAPERRAG